MANLSDENKWNLLQNILKDKLRLRYNYNSQTYDWITIEEIIRLAVKFKK